MTVIVTTPGIIIDVMGSYFYDKKSWQKMGDLSQKIQVVSVLPSVAP